MNLLKKKLRKQSHNTYKIKQTKIKHLGINLTEEVKDLYNENYKNLKKRN